MMPSLRSASAPHPARCRSLHAHPPVCRLSTVQDAHRIVVIQHGQVAEQGSHEALLEAGGVYAQLVSVHACVHAGVGRCT